MDRNETKVLIGSRIAAARKKANLSQTDVGARLGVHEQTVSKWERGVLTPSAPQLKELCSMLSVSADYLLALD